MIDLRGLYINCLGASNTEISKTADMVTDREYNYPSALAEKYGCFVRNYGISGTNIARTRDRGDSYCERAAFMDKQADIIIVQGGGNDASHNLPLGAERGTTSTFTYRGALSYLINTLKNTYPNAKLLFFTAMKKKKPLVRRDGLTHADFALVFSQVCEENGVPLYDFENDEYLDPANSEVMPDGLHMSRKACEYYADKAAEIIASNIKTDKH